MQRDPDVRPDPDSGMPPDPARDVPPQDRPDEVKVEPEPITDTPTAIPPVLPGH